MTDYVVTDHAVKRADAPEAYPECPVCGSELAYENQQMIAERTFLMEYSCLACDHEVLHEYRLEAVRTVRWVG